MTTKAKKLLLIFTAMAFCAAAGFAVPAPGGKGRIGSYNSPMQHSRTTANVSFPYPSNKWYGSIFTGHDHHAYSFRMSASPWLVNVNSNPSGSANGYGYVLGYPSLTSSANFVSNNYNPQYVARVSGVIQPANTTELRASGGLLDGYSDWSSTFIVRDSADSTKWIKTTIGKGFIFTYNEYSADLNPKILSYNNTVNSVCDLSGNALSGTVQGDCVLVKSAADGNGRVVYYAVYAPENTTFIVAPRDITVNFASSDRYLSIALITAGTDNASLRSNALAIFNDYRQYAYNFITDTKVSYSFDKANSKVTTTFTFTATPKRSGAGFAGGTVFALFPHQWKNSSAALKPASYNFQTIRGTLKVGAGSSFSTENKFFGILPNLTYEVPETSRSMMQSYINTDKNFTAQSDASDTYYSGKALAKAANLIPIFHQFGDIVSRNQMIARLKAQLTLWYTYAGQGQKYFAYDSNWGGLIGIPYAFSSENYTDHHFHYGYYIYASAILAMFDTQFAASGEYKGMVDLLVKDIYNPIRNDSDFPFLRHFDVYEGHSWANGFGGGDDRGIDQESSSEAMNAWAGVYLWGMASNNQDMIDLGAYGYTTEYEATKEYYFDTSGAIYGGTSYARKGIGILWDNESIYAIHFTPAISQTIKGIQVLPLTPSMLYLGYDTSYAQAYYNEMLSTAGSPANLWKDIWLRYKSLFDAAGALSDFIAGGFTAEEGSSMSLSYQFINFFNAYGTVDTSVAADNESFCVMNKSGQKNYIAFNDSTGSFKTVTFKNVPGGATAGSLKVPPMTTVVTKDFSNFKYDSLRTMYSDNNNYVLLRDIYSDSIKASEALVPAISPTYYLTIPFAFTLNAPSGYLNSVNGYVQLSNITIPSGYNANQIKLAVYSPETGFPDRVYPAQSITVESSSGSVATVMIEAAFTRTGTYVLVIPTGVVPPGSKLISGTIKNVTDNSDVYAVMQIYNSVDMSTTTEVFNGLYSIDVLTGVNYTITPANASFAFDPVNFTFIASSSDIVKNFTALPKYMLGGTILFNSRALNGIQVNVYDIAAGSTATAVTDSTGRYLADIVYGKNYTVTPVSAEYDFSPASASLPAVSASMLSIDFYAQITSDRFVVFPNPYKPSKHGNVGITFNGLKSGAEIKIYNIAGELVYEKKTAYDGPFTWYAENNSGYQAASGVYIYHIKSGGKTQKGKVAVER